MVLRSEDLVHNPLAVLSELNELGLRSPTPKRVRHMAHVRHHPEPTPAKQVRAQRNPEGTKLKATEQKGLALIVGYLLMLSTRARIQT